MGYTAGIDTSAAVVIDIWATIGGITRSLQNIVLSASGLRSESYDFPAPI